MPVILPFPLFFCLLATLTYVMMQLPRYSRDGDIGLRQSFDRKYSNPKTSTREEAWQRLVALANAPSTEVTWLYSLAFAIVLTLVFVGALAYAAPQSSNQIIFFSAVTVLAGAFFGEDIINRWRRAHRYNRSSEEQIAILERIRFTVD